MKPVYQTYTSQERKEYKLKEYTLDLCNRLDIDTGLDGIVESVIYVSSKIEEKFGPVRSNLKEAVVVVCISKTLGDDPLHTAQKLDLHQKYIYKIQKMVIQIPEVDSVLTSTTGPFEYILGVHKHILDKKDGLIDEQKVFPKVKNLVKYCIDNNILAKHTDITVGVACMYWVIRSEGYNVDLEVFSRVYNVSENILKSTQSQLRGVLIPQF